MEDTLLETDRENDTRALADMLREHKGDDVLILDLRETDGAWTDFFVIATASSNAHLDGLERHVKEFCHEREIEILRRSRKPAGAQAPQDEWRIIDLGSTVIHLMNRRTRDFYDLERLYSMAKIAP
ncbi:MAG: ribosome silencing factor [Treponema sp.]|jgi:ribosome-associated protein|nr:ribosome silencing factor [Treponema sp.]